MNKCDGTVSSTSTFLAGDKNCKSNRSEILSRATCDQVSNENIIETNKTTNSARVKSPTNEDLEPRIMNCSVTLGPKYTVNSGITLIDTQAKGKELKENTKKIEFIVNKELKIKLVKSSSNQNMGKEKQLSRKQTPDNKGDRKRKSTEMTEGMCLIVYKT